MAWQTKYKEEKFKLAEFGEEWERNEKGMHTKCDETGEILEIGNFYEI